MSKLPPYDQRMIDLMNYCIANGKADSKADFLKKIGFSHANNLNQVMEGKRSFTMEHILSAGKIFQVNINWIFGFENNMWRVTKSVSAIEQLKAAVISVESALKNGINKGPLTTHK